MLRPGGQHLGAARGLEALAVAADEVDRPVRFTRSISIAIRSPSRSLPIGPPASASGPTWPMHAPVETPEKRASVSSATLPAVIAGT